MGKTTNNKLIREIKGPDELYDITVLGHGLDEEGKTVCHLEEHEYMLGYSMDGDYEG